MCDTEILHKRKAAPSSRETACEVQRQQDANDHTNNELMVTCPRPPGEAGNLTPDGSLEPTENTTVGSVRPRSRSPSHEVTPGEQNEDNDPESEQLIGHT